MFPTCDLFFVAEMTAGTNLFVSVRMPRKFHTIGMVAQEIRSILLKLAVFQKVCVRKCTTDNSLKIQSQSPVRRVNVKKNYSTLFVVQTSVMEPIRIRAVPAAGLRLRLRV